MDAPKDTFQKFLVDAFLSGKKSGGKVISRAKGNKIVALLKGTCNESDPHLKFWMRSVCQPRKSDTTVLSHVRRVAYAEDFYDILHRVHGQERGHVDYKTSLAEEAHQATAQMEKEKMKQKAHQATVQIENIVHAKSKTEVTVNIMQLQQQPNGSDVGSFHPNSNHTTVCSGSTVQFVCSATDVTTVSYSLNSKPIPPLPPNVYISAPTVIGGAVVVHMSISNASANAVITCHAYLVNGAVLTRAAYLTVQGPPSPTTNLNITTYNGTATLLVWGPPPDAQSPSLLSYAVVIRNGSGAPVYSETVREPQLVITTPDPCGHFEATVTPNVWKYYRCSDQSCEARRRVILF
eukprot:Em0012g68a